MINTRSRKGCERVDFQDVVLALLLIAAGIRDCLTGQISNRLCVAGWAAGIAAGIVRRGATGLCFWAGGAVPAFILFFLCYLCGAVGAGDVKLLSAAAGFCGRQSVWTLVSGTLLIGGGMSVICLICRAAAGRSVRDLADDFQNVGWMKVRTCGHARAVFVIPLSPAILGAVVMWWLKGG